MINSQSSTNHGRTGGISLLMPLSGLVLIFMLSHGIAASAGETTDNAPSCSFNDSGFDPSTNVHAFEEYKLAIAELLKQEKFTELDCIANSARLRKARFSGGTWKLHKIYSGLNEPQPGHATQEDWRNHMARLNRWGAARPMSITARIALAESYVSYAWDARGTGYSDDVSDTGWKLFRLRVQKAKTILDQASSLRSKCPEWYVAMQQVAQGQSWNLAKATALYEQATGFEPGYDLYYRIQAVYLLPKWHGGEGDSARFAEQAADRIGGRAGDVLYFQIATEIVCPCIDPEFSRMSWPRLQKGFAELRTEYGDSLLNWNLMALMAFRANDPVAADVAFKHVGENWDKDTWKTAEWFHENKTWAAQLAPGTAHSQALMEEAKANLQTDEGVSYKKDVDVRLAGMKQLCAQKAVNGLDKFNFMIEVAKNGVVQDAWMTSLSSVGQCLMGELRDSHARGEAMFPPPPRDAYWLMLEIDPANFTSAAK